MVIHVFLIERSYNLLYKYLLCVVEQTFEIECRLSELDIISTGQGSSRRKAEQQAAQQALEMLGI